MKYLTSLFEDIKKDFSLPVYIENESLSREIILENGIQIVAYLKKIGWQREIAVLLNDKDDMTKITDMNGISFSYQKVINGGKVNKCLEMSQSNNDSLLFEIVVDSILQELRKAKNINKKTEVIQACVMKWKHFFERENEIIMSDNKQQGLYAELIILEELISKQGKEMVLHWTGCDKELHDFYINTNALEVKSSSVRQPYKINISSEYQLDKTDVSGDLLLFCLFLKKSSSDGENLCAVVRRINILLNNETYYINAFMKKLFQSGYIDGNEELYKCYFRKRDLKYYEVKEDFPCIVRSSLPAGINHVNYTIDIDQCEEFEISREEFWIKLGGCK